MPKRDEMKAERRCRGNPGISTVDVAVAVSVLHQQHLIGAVESFSLKGKSLVFHAECL